MAVTVPLLAFFVPLSLSRFVAADESYYLVAAKRVLEGAIPYRDFFYPQMPVLPYLFAGWHAIFGNHWVAARVFAAVLATAIGALLFLRLGRVSRLWAVVGVSLFASCGLVVTWYTTAKTVPASTLFLLAAYSVFPSDTRRSGDGGENRTPRGALVFCGVLVGLAAGVNVLFGCTIVGFLFHVLGPGAKRGSRRREASLLTSGFLLGLAPSFGVFLLDPGRFVFDNFTYHLSRYDWALDAPYSQKLRAALELVGLKASSQVSALQYGSLLVLSAAYGFRCGRSRRVPDPAFAVAALLIAASFVPAPTQVRYFATTVPFLVICACLLAAETRFPKGRVPAWLPAFVGVVFVAVWVGEGVREVRRVTVHGTRTLGVRPGRVDAARIATVVEISRRIDGLVQEGDYVLSFSPVFLFESHARVYPRMENQFWQRIQLTPAERKRYHLMSRSELWETMRSGVAPVVVLDRRRRGSDGRVLEESGYRLHSELHGIRIYHRPPPSWW